MSTPKHTPTNWNSVKFEDGRIVIYGPENDGVCVLEEYQPNHEANAKFIVHAVNLHDDLVKALESVLEYGLDYSPENQKDIEDHKSLEESLKSLLRRAKEGQ